MAQYSNRANLSSWIASANTGTSDFPIQNLPFGVFRRIGSQEMPRVGVAIGDMVLDVAACADAGALADDAETLRAVDACRTSSLNALMALGSAPRRALRNALTTVLSDGARDTTVAAVSGSLVEQRLAELLMPVEIGDYTDFYASVHHATNVGKLFRPDNPLLPNYKWVPIGYHGRASSIVVSGTPIRRPNGQRKGPNDELPSVGPSRSLDYELELGAFVSTGNPLGTTIPIADADEHLFGLCLLNDWSARDIQSWEYQPLGPFLAKNFASTISPWVVTMEALEPFRAPLAPRTEGDPTPLPYLSDDHDRAHGGFAITLDVSIRTRAMRERGDAPVRLTRSSALDLYWSMGQMLAHHASNGCNMRPGDLIGSGTISGAAKDSRGCLLELTTRGAEPVVLAGGEQRAFLEDGDEIVITAAAERDGVPRIGFGECRGIIAAATPPA